MPGPWSWIVVGALAWLAVAVLARTILNKHRGDPLTGLAYRFVRIYARLVHRLRVVGGEHVPRQRRPGPLLLVANHTAGIDPLLLQAACPFEIKWMMARDMMPAALDWLWRFVGVIPVNRAGPDSGAARAAIRHLKDGGVIGVYPEGGIERPPRRVLPFQPGVGLLVHKTGAPVLQAILDGTPRSESAWGSIFRRSRSVIRFLPPKDYAGSDLGAAEIAADLRERLIRETGWPAAATREPETQR